MELSSPLLHRFWFKTSNHYGIGVTAYSREDALELIKNAEYLRDENIESVVDDVDIRTLDQGQVIPNMGPPNFRGVWFPNFPK